MRTRNIIGRETRPANSQPEYNSIQRAVEVLYSGGCCCCCVVVGSLSRHEELIATLWRAITKRHKDSCNKPKLTNYQPGVLRAVKLLYSSFTTHSQLLYNSFTAPLQLLYSSSVLLLLLHLLTSHQVSAIAHDHHLAHVHENAHRYSTYKCTGGVRQ